jgi:hypothetical protein
MRQPHQDELLELHLRIYLGDVEPAALAELRACLEWMDVPAGQPLMTQGEAGDAMYLVLSGRLRAYVNDEDGTPRAVREMGRGQIVGEMSVITGEPRLATVVTVRDSVLVRDAARPRAGTGPARLTRPMRKATRCQCLRRPPRSNEQPVRATAIRASTEASKVRDFRS